MRPKCRRPGRQFAPDEVDKWLKKREQKKQYDKVRPKKRPGRPNGDFISYEDARAWVRRLKLKSFIEWRKFAKERNHITGELYRPKVIPANPASTYGDKYINDSDFLGTFKHFCFPYEKAKHEAKKLGLKSQKEWVAWHHKYVPRTVPRYPDEYYEEWESWGIFLGTGNKNPFERKKQYGPYEEIIKFVHTLNLKNQQEWLTWHRANNPERIPRRPDIVYDKWEGWEKWLGKTAFSKLEAAKVDTTALYIIHHPGYPSNVFEIGIERNGRDAVIERSRRRQLQIIKIYKHDPNQQETIDQIINANGSNYMSEPRMYLVRNLSQLCFDFDMTL